MKIGFLVAGFKGFSFFKSICTDCHVQFVASYNTKGTLHNSLEDIQSICLESGYPFFMQNDLTSELLATADIVFVAGWQYIIEQVDERFVVLHDSLLPKFRGFSPTVTSLILGKKEIGVTALKPLNSVVDTGEIYEQKSIPISYPIKIRDAYILLGEAYAQVARNILDKFSRNTLVSFPQNEAEATFSIWRDEDDYYIDWNWSAEKILRFVDAVGYPYCGARAIYKSKPIFIDQVVVSSDRHFEERYPGKIWCIPQGVPEVICGSGMIKILAARDEFGAPIVFDRLRERLTKKN